MAYNLQDLQSAVLDDLKDPNFSASRIQRYLNYGQNAIFNTHMFRFCEKSVTGTLTIGAYTFSQQSDHQATIGGLLYDSSSTNTRMELDEYSYLPQRDFFETYPLTSVQTNGMPTAWTEFGTQIYFNKPLDKAYTLIQRYYRRPTAMTTGASVPDVPEGFRELLEMYALFRAEKYRGNHDIAATYKQEFDDGLENMSLRFGEVTQVAPLTMGSPRTRVEGL